MVSDVAKVIIVFIAFCISIIVKPFKNKFEKQKIGIIKNEANAITGSWTQVKGAKGYSIYL